MISDSIIINVSDNDKCTESQLQIACKLKAGRYKLRKKNKRSSVWNVYREIVREDGTVLKWRYFCLGCKKVMQSTGGTTSNLRIHKCHARFLKYRSSIANGNLELASMVPMRSHSPGLGLSKAEGIADKLKTDAGNPAESPTPHFEEFFTCSDPEDTIQEDVETEADPDADPDADADALVSESEITEDFAASKQDSFGSPGKARPLIKFFSEESLSQEIAEDLPIEVDHAQIADDAEFEPESILPTSHCEDIISGSAQAEADSYAKAWAHAFLKLNEDQKFYAKRSIDELLVLGRLERLSISTVTALTTNL